MWVLKCRQNVVDSTQLDSAHLEDNSGSGEVDDSTQSDNIFLV